MTFLRLCVWKVIFPLAFISVCRVRQDTPSAEKVRLRSDSEACDAEHGNQSTEPGLSPRVIFYIKIICALFFYRDAEYECLQSIKKYQLLLDHLFNMQ